MNVMAAAVAVVPAAVLVFALVVRVPAIHLAGVALAAQVGVAAVALIIAGAVVVVVAMAVAMAVLVPVRVVAKVPA